MALNVGPQILALENIASSSGLFVNVLKHEPLSAPDENGETCAIIGSTINGVLSSGLAALSARVEIRMRIYTNAMQQPMDAIDTILLNSAGSLIGELCEAYALGGIARDVDFLGADGEPLRAELGYASIGGGGGGGGRIYRIADVLVPIVINDCWPLAE